MLGEEKNHATRNVWQRCVYLYSLESFLYTQINEIMRLVGDQEHENIWRSEVLNLHWGHFACFFGMIHSTPEGNLKRRFTEGPT